MTPGGVNGAVQAAIALAVVFGAPITKTQDVAIIAFCNAAGGVVTHYLTPKAGRHERRT